MLERTSGYHLPALPKPSGLLSASEAMILEERVSFVLPQVTDIAEANDYLQQVAALETLVKGKEAQPFMRGAQRRLEGRVGQLLGPAAQGERTDLQLLDHGREVAKALIGKDDATSFRLIARALDDEIRLSGEEWRQSRRATVRLIRERLGIEPQHRFSPIIKPSDNWNFSQIRYPRIDDGGGHGYIPGDIYANCLWYWSKPDDIVAEPMAGSGQIMAVYENRDDWGRPEPWDLDIYMFDLVPRGPYASLIKQNDLTVSLPLERANYIIIDVPYFGMVRGQYSSLSEDIANMDFKDWCEGIKASALSCAKAQKSDDLCTVISPNYRDVNESRRTIFLASAVVREAWSSSGYQLYDIAYASRRIQQSQNATMANLNNLAKHRRIMLTDMAEVMTFRREVGEHGR
jgi:ParB family chromosome partitioning protein